VEKIHFIVKRFVIHFIIFLSLFYLVVHDSLTPTNNPLGFHFEVDIADHQRKQYESEMTQRRLPNRYKNSIHSNLHFS
jgi:hypothetical protein